MRVAEDSSEADTVTVEVQGQQLAGGEIYRFVAHEPKRFGVRAIGNEHTNTVTAGRDRQPSIDEHRAVTCYATRCVRFVNEHLMINLHTNAHWCSLTRTNGFGSHISRQPG